MYSLDFEEFLWALGFTENNILYLKSFFDNAKPVDEVLHHKLLEYFRKYMILGGMPNVVDTYIKSNYNLNVALRTQKGIVDTCRNDISKYATNKKKVSLVFDSIPMHLMEKNKKFIIKNIDKNSKDPKSRSYNDAIDWLFDAGIAYYCYNITQLTLPFEWNEKRNIYKFFMRDTGLLASLSLNNIQKEIFLGNLEINEGAITENAIGEILYKNGFNLHYYDLKGKLEIDFVIEYKNKPTLIEVKSGKDYKKHSSLNKLIEYSNLKLGKSIVFCNSNIEETEKVIYYPFYMAIFMK